jgi:site-specific DNA-methyltransferase (adenine-specific)
MSSNIVLIHGDCMEGLINTPDKYYDLAIVDPPYGINAEQGTNRASRNQFKDKKYGWDSKPPGAEYFNELIRVSKNQIIWGANHFIDNLPKRNSKHWIIWDKKNPDRCFADCEMAWCSEMDNARIFSMKRVQELNRDDGGKIHPTQKPTALYKWQLKNYAKPGDKILDTHLGSGSIALACYDLGFDLTAYEIDEQYYTNAVKRLEDHKKQLTIF